MTSCDTVRASHDSARSSHDNAVNKTQNEQTKEKKERLCNGEIFFIKDVLEFYLSIYLLTISKFKLEIWSFNAFKFVIDWFNLSLLLYTNHRM